jgi:site-specific recombinase XerD
MHAALRSKIKDWLSKKLENVSMGRDMSTHRLLFQWASTKNLI